MLEQVYSAKFWHYAKFVRPQFVSDAMHCPIKKQGNCDIDLNELSFPPYSFLSCIRDLAEKFIAFHSTNSSHQLLTITYGDTITSNEQELLTNRRINCCTSEEDDTRLVRHVICRVETGCNHVVVRTVDTDVLVLIISHSPFLNEISNSAQVVTTKGSNSKKIKVSDVTELASTIGHSFCKGLPFFYAFNGCDTLSSMYNCSKTHFWGWTIQTVEYSLINGGISGTPESTYDSYFWARSYFGEIFDEKLFSLKGKHEFINW